MDEIAKKHHATLAWDQVTARIRAEMVRRRVHAARTVVLVPYAQLMHEARSAWGRSADAPGFVPRFETTMNWTRSLGGFEPGRDGIHLDAARDALTAASLLARAGLASHQNVLASRLMEAAWSLSRLAAAVPPEARLAWGARMAQGLSQDRVAPVLEIEARLGRIALAWAASASYPSDLVFSAQLDLLVVLEGFQAEPVAQALKQQWGDRVLSMPLGLSELPHSSTSPGRTGLMALHQAQDAQDEAHRAAACVLAHLAAGRSPVALVAQDRVLTRQVRALLAERGVAVRDETGWKLSTTRAAASLMGLLRAMVWDASSDAVLDWLKNAPGFDAAAVTHIELALRKAGTRQWRHTPWNAPAVAQERVAAPVQADTAGKQQACDKVQALREALQQGRPLVAWLNDLRTALQSSGQWHGLTQDPAGEAVLDALRLQDGAELAFAEFAGRMSQNEFTAWVSQALESASFLPAHPAQAQVVILPLSQLLGRALAAVVLPGCDEVRLPVSPEPPDMWTPAQRELLGLPSRTELAVASRAAWRYALQSPHLDLLWRTSEGGEQVMPSGFVQELLLKNTPDFASDPRMARELAAQPSTMPRPHGDALALTRLSASAYGDLRSCPYRFFALHQLALKEQDELDTELGKRDFGNWLHRLLKHFHEALKTTPTPELTARIAMINVAAALATRDLGLSESEFLPFAASWPRVREGYLDWLVQHEASGATFAQAETWQEMPLGALTLVGRIDRIDKNADGSTLVMDYKTEPRDTTRDRIKDAYEDSQLAFYAALLSDDTLAASYVNIGEKDPTQSYPQAGIVSLRDQLLEAIQDDMARIAGGVAMPALGEGRACEYCAARGLCRKDFWETM
ncbi:MAG: hypothetical protein RIS34_803 [Pseudomonadota bacterium]|jgi:ATP-dependent helicase/nuclease subunit B